MSFLQHRASVRGCIARVGPVLLVLLVLLSTGCVSTRLGPPPVHSWEQRLTALRAIPGFELEGRIAASDGHQGFSAGVRWQQQGSRATLDLSAPMGFGAARVQQGPDGLAVTTSRGVTLTRAAASDQLAATLGFEPPFGSLRFWVLGASDPADPAHEVVDDQQRLTHLEQDGWQVDCSDYRMVGTQWLPRRVIVTRQTLRLTLVVHSWKL